MTKCPYCGSKVNTTKELPKLSPREFKVFNILLQRGRAYTKPDELIDSGPEVSARVVIHNLNRKLASHGMVITNHRGTGYRLEEA